MAMIIAKTEQVQVLVFRWILFIQNRMKVLMYGHNKTNRDQLKLVNYSHTICNTKNLELQNFGRENFNNSTSICQIHQTFPWSKFCAIQ